MQIYNSMTRKKETFKPIHEGKVGIYACGPTVYNYFHIGNARPFIVFDVLRRYLEYRGYEVTFVQNFTDIDDKMIRRANEEGVTVKDVADKYIAEYFVDAKALGIRPATVHPRATEHIPQIIALIQRLVDKGLAYAVNGDVYYRVKAFPSYGCLCGQNLEDLENGARVNVGEQKEDPLDFALWKAQKPGEPAWESPWGMGRPGWHIECSAMSTTYLGETFDIHGGGKDLLFPHHENEIAQTSGATGKPYVNYWMHNGFINIDNEKMSKSKGNFFTVRDIAKEYDLEAVRMFMLSAHYRSPINFSRELIEAAASSLERLYIARDQLAFLAQSAQEREPNEAERAFMDECAKAEEKFIAAMDDDLNTADALAALFELVRGVHKLPQTGVSKEAVLCGQEKMNAICGVLGLLMKQQGGISPEVQALVDERAQARKNKDWKRSDELRDQIKAMGYILEDTPAGQKVRKGGA
ncbi:MAG: cysteine--tRNA ligase [Clostridiales bacterium]|nr:cysteine--tRNA ligase [Clostridiales bacterium]